jgi:hypothetical protein
MDSPESRPAPSPEPESDDSASPRNLQPDEAPDRLAFEPVPLRYRSDGLTPERQRQYVEALADCGVAREAAARVGLSERAINRVRRRADAVSFDNACEAAHMFGARRLRSIAYERAIEGIPKGRYYHGERVGEERVFDNRLLTYLLGKTGHLFEPPAECRSICDNWEDHMDALEYGLPAPDLARSAPSAAAKAPSEFTGFEVREDEEGLWWTSFPPPAGFDGEEEGEYGDDGYQRTLSEREQALVDAEVEAEDAEELVAERARRDRFFGFAGDGISSPGEAGTTGTSEPSQEDSGPIEYKSAFPPVPATSPAPSKMMRIHAEARRRGESPSAAFCAALPATAANDFLSGFAGGALETRPLRASAPPREPHSARSATKRRAFPPRRAFPR